jgi:hypothetical protein
LDLHLNYETIKPYELKIQNSDFLKKSEFSTPPIIFCYTKKIPLS